MKQEQHLQFIYYREPQTGEITGFIVEKIFDDSHFLGYKGPDKPTRPAFSGSIIYYTEEGFYLGGQTYKNGIPVGRALVSVDGEVLKSPNDKNAKSIMEIVKLYPLENMDVWNWSWWNNYRSLGMDRINHILNQILLYVLDIEADYTHTYYIFSSRM